MRIRSDIIVKLRHCSVDDEFVATSAWVSSGVETDDSEERIYGLESSLARDRHGSPFDDGFFSFYIEAPRAVRDEHVRHRNLSYSAASLRYKGPQTDGEMEFYVPPPHRPLKKAKGYKKIRPIFDPLTPEEYSKYVIALERIYQNHENDFKYLESIRPETEATRWVTNDGLYMPYIARGMLRPWLQFLQLRVYNADAHHPSYPMWEIEQVGIQIEAIIKEHAPLTWKAWNENGRDL